MVNEAFHPHCHSAVQWHQQVTQQPVESTETFETVRTDCAVSTEKHVRSGQLSLLPTGRQMSSTVPETREIEGAQKFAKTDKADKHCK